MSETNYMSRKANCNTNNWRHVLMGAAPSEFSFEVCSAACIAEAYCIGIETHADHASQENIWDNCMMIFEDSFEDCPDGDGTFWPKDCQCPPAPTPRPTDVDLCTALWGAIACSGDDDDDDGPLVRDETWFGNAAAARGPLLVVFIGAVAAALAH